MLVVAREITDLVVHLLFDVVEGVLAVGVVGAIDGVHAEGLVLICRANLGAALGRTLAFAISAVAGWENASEDVLEKGETGPGVRVTLGVLGDAVTSVLATHKHCKCKC